MKAKKVLKDVSFHALLCNNGTSRLTFITRPDHSRDVVSYAGVVMIPFFGIVGNNVVAGSMLFFGHKAINSPSFSR